jgi:hypothetical protein
VDLKIVDKWDGLTPLVIGSGENMVFPLPDLERLRQQKPNATPGQPSSAPNPRRPATR